MIRVSRTFSAGWLACKSNFMHGWTLCCVREQMAFISNLIKWYCDRKNGCIQNGSLPVTLLKVALSGCFFFFFLDADISSWNFKDHDFIADWLLEVLHDAVHGLFSVVLFSCSSHVFRCASQHKWSVVQQQQRFGLINILPLKFHLTLHAVFIIWFHAPSPRYGESGCPSARLIRCPYLYSALCLSPRLGVGLSVWQNVRLYVSSCHISLNILPSFCPKGV